jgi:hypothetical protein
MSLSRQERQRLQDDKFGPVTLHWRVTSMWGPSPQPANPLHAVRRWLTARWASLRCAKA